QIEGSSSLHQCKTAPDTRVNADDVAVENIWKLSGFLSGNLRVSFWEVKRYSARKAAAQAFVRRPPLTGSMRNGCTIKCEEESRRHFVAGNTSAASGAHPIEHFGFAVRRTHRASAHGGQSHLYVE